MTVAYKLMAEFPGQALKVFQVVADCADNDLGSDPSLVERASRARLIAMVHAERGGELEGPVPEQRPAN